MSNNCSITLNLEVFPICDFSIIHFFFEWCDLCTHYPRTIQLFTCLVAGKVDRFTLVINNSCKSIISNTLALPFLLLYPFLFCLSFSCSQKNSMLFGMIVPCPFVDVFPLASDFVLCGSIFHTLCIFGPSPLLLRTCWGTSLVQELEPFI